MRIKFIFLLYMIGVFTGLKAQSADEHIIRLLNKSDWFGLEEAYPSMEKKMQSEMLKLMAEGMLYVHFNKPEEAIHILDTLFTHYQTELSREQLFNLIALKSRLYAEQGKYQHASYNAGHFLNQLPAFNMVRDSFPEHIFMETYYDWIGYIPQPTVSRPHRNVAIPLFIENAADGKRMYIPVTIHGKEYRFMLDMGSPFTYVSDRMAKDMNLHIADDDLEGFGQRVGKTGAIDSMQIGELKVKDLLVMVGVSAPGDTDPVEAVLGINFFRLMGETQFLPKAGKVIFPINKTKRPKTGRNLMVDNNQSYIKLFSGKEKLIFHLNTWLTGICLYEPYFSRHADFIISKSNKEWTGMEAGGIKAFPMYRLPQLSLKVGRKKFKESNVPVYIEKTLPTQQEEVGTFGMDIITQFRKVVVNYDEMFIDLH